MGVLLGAGVVAAPLARAAEVTGGSTVPTAVALQPGRYTDVLPVDDGAQPGSRYYRVAVDDGEQLHVVATVSAVTGPGDDADVAGAGQTLSVTLFTPTGQQCGSARSVGGFGGSGGSGGGATLTAGVHPPAVLAGSQGCSAPGEVVVAVQAQVPRPSSDDGETAPTPSAELPVDLLVRVQPELAPLADAPDDETAQVSPGSGGTTSEVAGADSWVGAPVLAPGTYSDAVAPGTARVYALDVGWGQRPAFMVQAAGLPAGDRVEMTLANPVLEDVPLRGTTQGGGTLSASAATGVRPQNSGAGGDRANLDVAGTYYLTVHVSGGADDGSTGTTVGSVVLGLQVDAVGTALAAPDVLGRTTESAPAPVREDRPSRVTGWVTAGVLAVLGLGLLALARRRQAQL